MVLETKSSLEAGVVGAGHSFAGSRLDAQRNMAGWVNEQMGGISYLDFIRRLVGRVESDWESVQADLEAIRCGVVRINARTQSACLHGITAWMPAPTPPAFTTCCEQKSAAAAAGSAAQHDSR